MTAWLPQYMPPDKYDSGWMLKFVEDIRTAVNFINVGNGLSDTKEATGILAGDSIQMNPDTWIKWGIQAGLPDKDMVWLLDGTRETYIDQAGIFTDSVITRQVNSQLVRAENVIAYEQVSMRGYPGTDYGRNPSLLWKGQSSAGTSSIIDIPVLPGSATESDDLYWYVNSTDLDGTQEAYRGRVFLVGSTAAGDVGWADLIVHGTIQVGSGLGSALSPWYIDILGDMYWPDKGPIAGYPGGEVSIKAHGGGLTIDTTLTAFHMNPMTDGGPLMEIIEGTTSAMSLCTSGAQKGLMVNGVILGAGGGGTSTPARAIALVYPAGDAGVNITRDGVTEQWLWSRDATGRVLSMLSDGGRTINITY